MRKLQTFAALAGAVFALSACGTKDAPGPLEPTGPTGRIRFVNLITDATRVPVNPILESLPFGAGVGFGVAVPASQPAPATANYAAIYAGSRSLVLKKTADTTVTVATFPLTITASTDITVYATGGAAASAVTSFITTDDNTSTDATQAVLRIVNIAPAVGALDVFVTAPNADLSAATPTFAALAVKSQSANRASAAGTFQVRAVPAGTLAANRAAAVVANVSITLTANTGRTIVISDKAAGGTPLVTFTLTDR